MNVKTIKRYGHSSFSSYNFTLGLLNNNDVMVGHAAIRPRMKTLMRSGVQGV